MLRTTSSLLFLLLAGCAAPGAGSSGLAARADASAFTALCLEPGLAPDARATVQAMTAAVGGEGCDDAGAKLAQRTSLALSNVRDLTALATVPWINRLTLSAHGPTAPAAPVSLAPLGALTGLKDLRIQSIPVDSVAPLAGLQALERLVLQRTRLSSLAGFGDHPALTELDLSLNELPTLTGLGRLPKLAVVTLGVGSAQGDCFETATNTVEDLSPLASAPLRGLVLDNVPVARLDSLGAARATVEDLSVGCTRIADPEQLQGFGALTYLSLARTPLPFDAGAQPLPLPALVSLDLSGKEVGSFAAVRSLPHFASLDLSGAKLTAFDELLHLPLTSLRWWGSDVDDAKLGRLTEALPNLVSLSLAFNHRITDVSPVTRLGRLETLDLQGSAIESLEPLRQQAAALGALRSVDLSFNRIRDATPLAALPGLTSVILEGNPVAAKTAAPDATRRQGIEDRWAEFMAPGSAVDALELDSWPYLKDVKARYEKEKSRYDQWK